MRCGRAVNAEYMEGDIAQRKGSIRRRMANLAMFCEATPREREPGRSACEGVCRSEHQLLSQHVAGALALPDGVPR